MHVLLALCWTYCNRDTGSRWKQWHLYFVFTYLTTGTRWYLMDLPTSVSGLTTCPGRASIPQFQRTPSGLLLKVHRYGATLYSLKGEYRYLFCHPFEKHRKKRNMAITANIIFICIWDVTCNCIIVIAVVVVVCVVITIIIPITTITITNITTYWRIQLI